MAGEIASAGSVLIAAGITPVLPTAVEAMPDEVSELFGYVVREAVTNVVRHSEATRCVITVDRVPGRRQRRRPRLRRRPAAAPGCSGWPNGCRRAGGVLEVPHGPGGGTTVTASLAGSTADPAPLAVARSMIKVLVADDQALIRQAFAALLQLEPDLEVVGQAADVPQVVDLAAQHRPRRGLDGRPDAGRPERAGRRDRRHRRDHPRPRPRTRVIILTTFGRPGYLRRAMEAGAVGFMVKDAPADQLVEAIRRVPAGCGWSTRRWPPTA